MGIHIGIWESIIKIVSSSKIKSIESSVVSVIEFGVIIPIIIISSSDKVLIFINSFNSIKSIEIIKFSISKIVTSSVFVVEP